MPSLKKLTKKLHQEIISYLFPFPPSSKNSAFRLAILIFAKTRFCSHIKFVGRCLHSKVIPKGFRSNFHASSLSHSSQYLRHIQSAQNSFSCNIMRITIRAMCQKHNSLDKQIIQCRSELSKICPAILAQSICTKIQEVNPKRFNHLHQIKAHKLEQLTGPPNTCDSSLESLSTIVKGLNFVPTSKKLDEFSVKQDVENLFAAFNLKRFSMTKRMILTPRAKTFSRRFRLQNQSGLPQRASSPL